MITVFDARTLRIYEFPQEVMTFCERMSILEVIDLCNVLAYKGKLNYSTYEVDNYDQGQDKQPTFTIFENMVKVC